MGRYDRQLKIFGPEGQGQIGSAKVGLVGCGGLGTNVATALASAGVGEFVIMDPDRPEESNLNRQYVYCGPVSEHDDRAKAEILSDWIGTVNPDAKVTAHVRRFDERTSECFDGCDIMVDCLDSIGGRMELNDYCMRAGKPLVHGAIDGFVGQVATCIPGKTPCLRCMMDSVPESGRTPSSIGAVVSIIGSLEAAEVLKLITGRCGSAGTFLSVDLEKWHFQTIRFEHDPDCPACGRLWKRSVSSDLKFRGGILKEF